VTMRGLQIALLLVTIGCAFVTVSAVHEAAAEDDGIIALLDAEDEEAHDTDHVRLAESASTVESEGIGMSEEAEFERFTKQHKKQYKSHGEYRKRYGVWKENLDFVRKWNSDQSSAFEVGMNEFADLTDDEFAASYLNKNLHDEYLNSETFKSETLLQESSGVRGKATESEEAKDNQGYYDIRWHKNTGESPDKQDWTEKGAVSAVNNQAKCFACYAFAAAGAIEGAVKLRTGKLRKLSAQQIVDCSVPSSGFMNHGCKGGTMVKSYKYIIKNGLMPWEDYGYRTSLNSRPECKLMYSRCKFKKHKVVQTIKGYVNIRKGVENDLKNAVGMRPVSAAIDAHHRPFKLYRSGVFSLASCTTHLTHGLLVVGYGEKDGHKYWKVKNSWGTTWGHNGYGMVIRDRNMCAIGNWANYPIIPDDHVSTVRSLSELGDDIQDLQSTKD